MESKDNKKEQYLQNRKALIELSKTARLLVKEEAYNTVNEALTETYRQTNTDITEFNTFWQWKAAGYTIIKGSKAFLVWGQPRKVSQVPDGATEPEEFKYWPVCYLFSNTQVVKPQLTQTQPEPVYESLPL